MKSMIGKGGYTGVEVSFFQRVSEVLIGSAPAALDMTSSVEEQPA